jgi:hypothetical protein
MMRLLVKERFGPIVVAREEKSMACMEYCTVLHCTQWSKHVSQTAQRNDGSQTYLRGLIEVP